MRPFFLRNTPQYYSYFPVILAFGSYSLIYIIYQLN